MIKIASGVIVSPERQANIDAGPVRRETSGRYKVTLEAARRASRALYAAIHVA